MKSCILLFGAILGLISCKDDTLSIADSLRGVWYYDTPGDQLAATWRQQIRYGDNGEFEQVALVVDVQSGDIVGYQSRAVGKYFVDGSTIRVSLIEGYRSEATESPYAVPLSQLVTDSVVAGTVKDDYFKLIEGGRKLLLTFSPCGPNGYCIANLTFTKQ